MNKNKDFTYKNLENGGDSVKSEENIITKAVSKKVSRRTFIKTAAVAGGAAVATGAINFATAATYTENTPVGTAGVEYKRTTCFGCNASCGVQVKVVDGVAVKIDGNPFDRQVADITYAGTDAATGDVTNVETQIGRICAKGQAGIKSAYTPERILQPLRRVGARGSSQWEAVSWSTAITEIVTGSSTLGTPGLHDLVKTDAIDRADLHADFRQSTDYEVANDRLTTFGPKSRQIVYTDGRNHLHNHAFFHQNLLGTDRVDHSSVCNGSWKTAGKLTYGEYITKSDIERTNYLISFGTNPLGEAQVPNTFQNRKLAGKLRDSTFTLVAVDVRKTTTASKADRWHAIKSGGDGALALGMIKHIIEGGLLDGAAPTDKKSNGDTFTNDCKTYLRCPNQTVATAQTTAALTAGFRNYSDASWLISPASGGTGKYALGSNIAAYTKPATAADGAQDGSVTPLTELTVDSTAGFPNVGSVTIGALGNFAYTSKTAATFEGMSIGVSVDDNETVTLVQSVGAGKNVVLVDGIPRAQDDNFGLADLDAEIEIGGITYKTVFKVLKELAAATSWAAIHAKTGITANAGDTETAIKAEAEAFWNATNPSIMQYRGASMTSNGTYNAILIHALTTLRNRWDMTGGQHLVDWTWGATGTVTAAGTNSQGGVKWDRTNKTYAEVKGANSPATASLAWPKGAESGAQQEVFAGLAAGYPFKAKALMMYGHNPVYTHPGATAYASALSSTSILPLFVSFDLFINETNQYADFILPDTSWLERWGFGRNPNYGGPVGRNSKIRRPVIGTFKTVTINGHATKVNQGPNSTIGAGPHLSYQDFLASCSGPLDIWDIWAAIGNTMKSQASPTAGTNAYGANGLGAGKHFYTAYDLHNYIWAGSLQSGGTANSLAVDLAEADANAAETDGSDVTGMSVGARHLWMGLRANTTVWEADNIYSSRRKGNTIKIMPDTWAEVANGRGYTIKQVPLLDDTVKLSTGAAVDDSDVTYPFTVSQYKDAWHTQARSTNNEWLLEIRPENTIDINPLDAALAVNGPVVDGDTVEITSATNENGVTAKVRLSSTVKRGVAAASHHFGRTQQGAATQTISGGQGNIVGNPEIAAGVTLTPVTRSENGFTITDNYGGACVFYGTRIKIEKL